MSEMTSNRPAPGWRERLHTVIFESDTAAGKAFDIALLLTILLSVLVVMLDSVPAIRAQHGDTLLLLEWLFTIIFSVEYVLRLLAVRRPLAYSASFFGVVDLVALVPTYLSVLLPGTQYLLVVRVLRLLRMFRILKLTEYLHEGATLRRALWASRRKISVFLLTVVTITIIVGAVMYVVEGAENGFTSIPISIYWAVVTLTTVGYGDLSPQTPLGQALAVLVMLLGYGIIAVPTGIVTAELTRPSLQAPSAQACRSCGKEGHEVDARFCNRCGAPL